MEKDVKYEAKNFQLKKLKKKKNNSIFLRYLNYKAYSAKFLIKYLLLFHVHDHWVKLFTLYTEVHCFCFECGVVSCCMFKENVWLADFWKNKIYKKKNSHCIVKLLGILWGHSYSNFLPLQTFKTKVNAFVLIYSRVDLVLICKI